MGLQPEDVWRALADQGPSTAEHIAVRTGSTLDGVMGYLREDQHYERVTASTAPDGSYVYALLPAGAEALHRAESFSLMLDLLDDAVQPSQPWAIAEGLGEELELVTGLIERGVQGRGSRSRRMAVP